MRVETIGDATLYLGDCREVLPLVGPVDAVITDPPYGVRLGKLANNNVWADGYDGFEDEPWMIKAEVVPRFEEALRLAKRALVTCGIRNLQAYPTPTHIGSINYPAAAGVGPWGFTCWQPMLYYGTDPYRARLHDSFTSTERAEKNGHPCPKPIGQMRWMVDRASYVGETVLDPFMGSGTTGAACIALGRKFIGIEREPRYFDIACEQLTKAWAQRPLFAPEPTKPEQCVLVLDVTPENEYERHDSGRLWLSDSHERPGEQP